MINFSQKSRYPNGRLKQVFGYRLGTTGTFLVPAKVVPEKTIKNRVLENPVPFWYHLGGKAKTLGTTGTPTFR